MSKSYDLTDWEREEYVQEAHEECGSALQMVRDLLEGGGPGHGLTWTQRDALVEADKALTSLRERLALRLADLLDDEVGT